HANCIKILSVHEFFKSSVPIKSREVDESKTNIFFNTQTSVFVKSGIEIKLIRTSAAPGASGKKIIIARNEIAELFSPQHFYILECDCREQLIDLVRYNFFRLEDIIDAEKKLSKSLKGG